MIAKNISVSIALAVLFSSVARAADGLPALAIDDNNLRGSNGIDSDENESRHLVMSPKPGELCWDSMIPDKFPWWCSWWSCDNDDIEYDYKFYQKAKTLRDRDDIKKVLAAIFVPTVMGYKDAGLEASFERALNLIDSPRTDARCALEQSFYFFCKQSWWGGTRVAMEMLFFIAAHAGTIGRIGGGNDGALVMEWLVNTLDYEFNVGYMDVLNYWNGAFDRSQIKALEYRFEAFCA